MAKSKPTLDSIFQDTADAIRRRTGDSATIKPVDFADTIDNLPGPTGSITLEQNGTYNVGNYLNAVVAVPDEPTAVDELTKLYTGTSVDVTIKAGITSLAPYRFYNFDSLKSIDFNQVTSIPQYTCYDCNNLETITLNENTTNIDSSAFYNCTKATPILPKTISSFGSSACYCLGNTKDSNIFGFQNDSNNTNFGSYAFQNSGIQYLIGKFGTASYGAFQNCSKLKQVNISKIKINDSYVFSGCTNVENTIEKPSSITCSFESSSSGVFRNFARSRADNNYLKINITAGAATTVGSYCFAGDGTSSRNKYLEVTLPSNISNLESQAFAYNDHLILYLNGAPDITTNTFSGCIDSYVLVDDITIYNKLIQKSNWANLPSGIILACASFGSKFGLGAELPPYTAAGYKLTWYTDNTYSQEVTHVTDEQALYFAKQTGTVREAAWLTKVSVADCTVNVVDTNTGRQYKQGDYILLDTTVRITTAASVEHPNWILAQLKVGSTEITEGTLLTVTEDIRIAATYTEDGELHGWIFGIRGLSENQNYLERTDDSEDFEIVWNATKKVFESQFDDYFNFEEIEINGFPYLKIPTIYFEYTNNDSLRISNTQYAGFSPYKCFKRDDGSIADEIYVGKYMGHKVRQKGEQMKYSLTGLSVLTAALEELQAQENNKYKFYFGGPSLMSMLFDLFLVVTASKKGTTAWAEFKKDGKYSFHDWDYWPCLISDDYVNNDLPNPKSVCSLIYQTGNEGAGVFKFYGLEGIFYGYGLYMHQVLVRNDNIYYFDNPYYNMQDLGQGRIVGQTDTAASVNNYNPIIDTNNTFDWHLLTYEQGVNKKWQTSTWQRDKNMNQIIWPLFYYGQGCLYTNLGDSSPLKYVVPK